MKKYCYSLLFGVLFSVPTLACLNGDTLKLEDGTMLYEDYDGFVPYGHMFVGKEDLITVLESLEKGYKETNNLNYLSDKGLILIIQGRYKEAIELYKKIETLEPNRYSTASNIGTAYELIGNNTEALKWIEKAVKIDPKSHFDSEWIHVNILRAKIKGDQFISSEFLLGNDFGKEKLPTSDMQKKDLLTLRQELYYQLNERITFVKPKDKIVAQLLFDLGNISYLIGDKEEAMEDYQLAEKYGYAGQIIEKRSKLYSPKVIDNIERKIVKEGKYQIKPTRRSQWMETLVSVFALIVSGLIIFIFRKKIFPMLK